MQWECDKKITFFSQMKQEEFRNKNPLCSVFTKPRGCLHWSLLPAALMQPEEEL
jgi:hypothetical protein